MVFVQPNFKHTRFILNNSLVRGGNAKQAVIREVILARFLLLFAVFSRINGSFASISMTGERLLESIRPRDFDINCLLASIRVYIFGKCTK